MRFQHNPLPVIELNSVERDKKRFYLVDGEELPSVTTVLSSFKSGSLSEWRNRVGKEVADKIATTAASRGTAVHKICEDYVNNLDDYLKGKMPLSISLFNQIKEYLDKNLESVYNIEIPLYSKKLKAAGRCDMLCRVGGKVCIVDYKTSTKIKKVEWIENYFQQTTAYAIMVEELYNLPVDNIILVIAVEEENTPQIFVRSPNDYRDSTINLFNLYHNNVT
jgi:genome maintenance exonuclease 1